MTAQEKSKTLTKHGKIRILLVAAAFVVCAAAVFAVWFSLKADFTVAKINEITLGRNEFRAELEDNAGMLKAAIMSEYGVVSSKFDWNAVYGETKAVERLRELALGKLVKIKLVQSYCVKYELLDDASYGAFLEKLRKENERLNSSDSAGVKKYGEREYYDKLNAEYLAELERYMRTNVFQITEEDGRAYWQSCYDLSENKDEFAPYEDAPEQWLNGAADIMFERWMTEITENAVVVKKPLYGCVKM